MLKHLTRGLKRLHSLAAFFKTNAVPQIRDDIDGRDGENNMYKVLSASNNQVNHSKQFIKHQEASEKYIVAVRQSFLRKKYEFGDNKSILGVNSGIHRRLDLTVFLWNKLFTKICNSNSYKTIL